MNHELLGAVWCGSLAPSLRATFNDSAWTFGDIGPSWKTAELIEGTDMVLMLDADGHSRALLPLEVFEAAQEMRYPPYLRRRDS